MSIIFHSSSGVLDLSVKENAVSVHVTCFCNISFFQWGFRFMGDLLYVFMRSVSIILYSFRRVLDFWVKEAAVPVHERRKLPHLLIGYS